MRKRLFITLNLKYYSSNIIHYKPSAKQWWVTGFNSNYDNKNRDTLTASYSMTFSTRSYSCSFNEKMYNSFKQKWDGKKDKIVENIDHLAVINSFHFHFKVLKDEIKF